MEEKDISLAEAPVKKKRHFILSVIAIALVLLFGGTLLWELPMLGIRALFPNMSAGAAFLLLYLSFITIDAAVLVYCALCEKDIFRSFLPKSHGGAVGNTLKHFGVGLLVGFGLNALCVLLAWLHGDIHLYAGRFELPYLLCALVCVCVQSSAEELITRGYMMGALQKRYPVWVAVATNSLLFAVLHLANAGVTPLSVLTLVVYGVAMSLFAYTLQSIWMCMAIHTAWNFTQNFLFGLPNSGIVAEKSFLHLEAASDSLFYNVGFGVEGSLTAVLLLTGVCVGIVLYARKKG